MDDVWSIQDDDVSCVFGATPKLSLRKLVTKSRNDLPVIEISYSLEDLMTVVPLLVLVRQRKIKPRVFLLKEKTSRPEVVVTFEIIGVPHWQLGRLFGKELIAACVKPGATTTLLTTAAAKTEGWQFRRFLSQYAKYKEAYIVVSETTSKYTLQGKLDPILFFTVKRLERTTPAVRMY